LKLILSQRSLSIVEGIYGVSQHLVPGFEPWISITAESVVRKINPTPRIPEVIQHVPWTHNCICEILGCNLASIFFATAPPGQEPPCLAPGSA